MPEDTQLQEAEIQKEEATDEGQQQEELQASEKPETEGDLDQSVKDRTREQFEKLKKSNLELKEELEQLKRKNTPSVIESLRPQGPPPAMPQAPDFNKFVADYSQQSNLDQKQVKNVLEGLVDAEGYVNPDVLTAKLNKAEEAERKAREAEKRANQALNEISNFQANQQARELHSQYPELDPNSKEFKPEAYELVKNELLNQMVNTGKQDGLAAAAKMSRYFRSNQPEVKSDKDRSIEQKKQAIQSVANTGKSQRSITNEEYEDLKVRSMTDPKAMAERLKLAGY